MTDVAPSTPAAAPSSNGSSGPSGGSSGPAGGTGGGAPTQVIPSTKALEAGYEPPDSGSEPRGGKGEPGKDPAAPKPRASKHTFKRLGAEQTLELEQALAMLGDDFEHEVPIGEEKRKVRYPELVRGYQMSDGALTRMRQAAEIRKQNEELLAWGRNPENHGAFLEQHLGIDDHVNWAAEVIRRAMKDETELQEMLQSDPHGYHKKIEARAAQKLQKQSELKARKEQETRTRAERVQRQKDVDAQVTEAFKAGGLPRNDSTMTAAARIYKQYADVGYELPYGQLVDMVRQEYVSELRGYVAQLGDDELVGLLGDELRDKLRKLELKTLRGAKKQDPETPRPSGGGNGHASSKGITANEYLRGR